MHLAGEFEISYLLNTFDILFAADGLLTLVTAYVDENYNLVTSY